MIRLSREVRASIGQGVEPGPVRNAWAGWPTAALVSPYLIARVTVSGMPDPVSGYLCDIKVLDAWVSETVLPVLESMVEGISPRGTLATAILSIGSKLMQSAPANTTWEELELFVSPYLRFSVQKERIEMVRLTEQFEFSAAHRLHASEWSDEQNLQSFGKCNNPNGHGHNYVVDVTIEGHPEPESGMLLPLGRLEEIVQQELIKRFDHKHLNVDTAEFQRQNPSVENIARVAWKLLEGKLSPARLARVRVYETAKTWVDYEGE
ncbi:6-carboxytetrahydropterin synthase [bacterium]|nr:6-carboxytetrahydropterin synthase [bacterium]